MLIYHLEDFRDFGIQNLDFGKISKILSKISDRGSRKSQDFKSSIKKSHRLDFAKSNLKITFNSQFVMPARADENLLLDFEII